MFAQYFHRMAGSDHTEHFAHNGVKSNDAQLQCIPSTLESHFCGVCLLNHLLVLPSAFKANWA